MNAKQKTAARTTAADVEKYLKRYPNFFVNRLELLAKITVPHGAGAAASLLERQVAVLREQQEQARRRLHELVEVARANEDLARRIRRLALNLAAAKSLDELFAVLYENLARDFQADRTALRLFAKPLPSCNYEGVEFVGETARAASWFKDLVARRRPLGGKPEPRQRAFLFGAPGADIESVVLLPLHGVGRGGVVAIGSRDPQRFQENMAVELLAALGDAVSFIIKPWAAG